MNTETDTDDDFELEIEGNPLEEKVDKEPEKGTKAKADDDYELEIKDDTPIEDRGRPPMPPEIVEELEKDELDEYSDKVKQRIKQFKKVYHDERRAKEQALRESNAAVEALRKLREENQNLKKRYDSGEKTLADTYKQAATLELENAKRAYKDAYDSGNTDELLAAQEALNDAQFKLHRVKAYEEGLQRRTDGVYNEEEPQSASTNRPQVPEPDKKTKEWQAKNTWFGRDPEMTSFAMGVHQKLTSDNGPDYARTDEYWSRIDSRMREVFPDKFDDAPTNTHQTDSGGGKPTERSDKPPVNVASATRSSSPKKVVLSRSQLAIAKRLGVDPKEYAKEMVRLQKQER